MKSTLLGLALGAATGAIPAAVNAGTVTSDGADLVIKTKGGFEAKTADSKFTFKLGGRVQLQADSFNDSMNLIKGDGKTGSDLYFRRARVYISGDVYKDWAYKIQFNVVDSGSGGGSVEDLYIKWKRYGLASVTMGKHKEPFSLEELTSSKYVTSIERSPINSFFAEGRNLGLSLSGATDFWGYGIGVFDNGNDDNGAQEFAYTGRVFLSPINRERALLHLGVGMSHRNAPNANLDRSVTQGIKKGDTVAVSVDPFDSQDILGLELAGKIGPFHGSAEYQQRATSATDNGEDASASGYYVEAGWFITGESRPYEEGTWEKVKPNRPGLGAWEVFVKQSGVDLDDSGIAAANRNKGDITTLGVNWYANEIIRVSANYVYAQWDQDLVASGGKLVRADSVALEPGMETMDSGHGFAVRVQAAF
jgi:phosphate-selective porin OprO/OprP